MVQYGVHDTLYIEIDTQEESFEIRTTTDGQEKFKKKSKLVR